jgi:hypothetical protein
MELGRAKLDAALAECSLHAQVLGDARELLLFWQAAHAFAAQQLAPR